jgi:hypothetical protein
MAIKSLVLFSSMADGFANAPSEVSIGRVGSCGNAWYRVITFFNIEEYKQRLANNTQLIEQTE